MHWRPIQTEDKNVTEIMKMDEMDIRQVPLNELKSEIKNNVDAKKKLGDMILS